MKKGPVFNVADDQEIVKKVWKELGYKNELLFFQNGEAVLEHLKR